MGYKHVSMSYAQSDQCIVRPRLIDLNPGEIYFHPFVVSLDRWEGSCNTVEDSFGEVCVSNQMEVVNLKVFTLIKEEKGIKNIN